MTMHNVPSAEASTPLDWLVTPALAFSHPNEVLTNRDLTDPERKAILASWASDARAVEGKPWLRRLENGSTVTLAAVLDALSTLDRDAEKQDGRMETRSAGRLARLLRRRPGLSIHMEGLR